ncbi:MAG: glycerate kinase [Kordiimonadaceae bacterium]|nr:glycerate kinase [Kordiimonadaceae bacterium]
MTFDPKSFLIESFNIALEAALPRNSLPLYLDNDRSKAAIVIGAGKAAASMAAAFENNWHGPISGLVVTPYGHSVKCEYIEIIEAAHPTPDQMSLKAAEKILALTKNLGPEDNVFVFLSGGGSSLLTFPPERVEFEQKQSINKALLKSGADIDDINTVRKHLSNIKGGRLATHCYPAQVRTYAISDVMGDDPSVIASGPTIADTTTSKDAQRILERHKIETPTSVTNWLNNPQSESIKPNNPAIKNSKFTIISNATYALKAAQNYAAKSGIQCLNLGELNGDAVKLGREHASLVMQNKLAEPLLIISGGETTVKVIGNGKGGRNTEYLLSLAIALKGQRNVYALSTDTDGIDGTEDNAGAFIDDKSIERAKALKIDLNKMLENNDSYSAFQMLDDLIITGPTRTNVNDYRAILIMPAK